jgi:hypothetical protein
MPLGANAVRVNGAKAVSNPQSGRGRVGCCQEWRGRITVATTNCRYRLHTELGRDARQASAPARAQILPTQPHDRRRVLSPEGKVSDRKASTG